MKILVTGGAGFIGSHLCERLLAEGHHVVCLDNMFTGRRENIEHLAEQPGFELMRHDVTEPLFMDVDQIYNLACPASPIHYQYNPVKTVKSNVLGAINMLVLAKRVRARVLQASTSEVYGDPTVHPQTESYWGNVNPIGPRSCYDEGKRVAETLMMDYHRQDKVDIRIARIFNTYGPRMAESDGRVVSNFIVQALRGQELTLYGTGEQTRSFCYVDELVDGLMRLMAPKAGTSRSTWATRSSSPSASLPPRSPGSSATRCASPIVRFPQTIPPSASRTSPARGSGSAGSRKSTLPRACSARWTTSGTGCRGSSEAAAWPARWYRATEVTAPGPAIG